MRLFVASAPPYTVLPPHVTPVRAAYRIEGGTLCALSQPEHTRGGVLLITEQRDDDLRRVLPALLGECHRRGYGGVAVPFPAPTLVTVLRRPLREAGLALWVNEGDGLAASECRVLVNTALTGGNLEDRLSSACRTFGAERIVLDVQRLRTVYPLPCTGEGTPLSGEELHRLRQGRPVYYAGELGARYFTCRWQGRSGFVLFDDGDTLRRKLALGERLRIPRALLTLPESEDVLADVLAKKVEPETNSGS